MRNLGAFLAVALLMFGLASEAYAKSGKGKMEGLDRGMKADRLDRNLGNELDSSLINKRFTEDLKILKKDLDKGNIDKSEFDKKAADLQADFLKNFRGIGTDAFEE